MLTLPGKITISRSHGGTEEKPVNITIQDKLSGCYLLEVHMSLLEYANALTGMGSCECLLEYYPDCPAGKKREVKHELVFISTNSYNQEVRAKAIRKALKPLEVDGWKGRDEDAQNGHNTRKYESGKGYWSNVGFMRFVAASTPSKTEET